MSAAEDHNKTQAYQYQAIDQAVNITNKKRIIDIMQGMVNASPAELNDAISTGYHTDASVNVTHPINELSSPGTVAEKLWKPLRHAIPDVERRDDIVLGGVYRGTNWIGCLGHYIGTFENDWMDIPATRGIVSVRYAEGHELRDGKIVKSYHFIDFLDLMRQAGYWPIAPSLGCEMRWLAPRTHDGVILTPQDNETSRRTIERIRTMHLANIMDSRPHALFWTKWKWSSTGIRILCGWDPLALAQHAGSKASRIIIKFHFYWHFQTGLAVTSDTSSGSVMEAMPYPAVGDIYKPHILAINFWDCQQQANASSSV